MKIRVQLPFTLLAIFALQSSFAPTALAQATPNKTNDRGTEIMLNIGRIDVLKFVLPVLMDKKQLNEILSGLEKCRTKEQQIRDLDLKELAPLEAEVSKAVEKGIDEGDYPNRDLQAKIIKITSALGIRRSIAINENIDLMLEVIKKHLREDQRKVMANIMEPSQINPGLKKSEMKEDEKLKLYIRQILIDPFTYDVLKKLYKKAK
jgi:hypothetical protein